MLQRGLATFSLAKWSLLFKACRDGASTATRGNEFQLSTTQMGRDVDLDLYRATYGLIQLAFVPSYCCTSIHFQEADVDTVQAMRILYLKVSVMCLLSLGRYFVLDYFRIESETLILFKGQQNTYNSQSMKKCRHSNCEKYNLNRLLSTTEGATLLSICPRHRF